MKKLALILIFLPILGFSQVSQDSTYMVVKNYIVNIVSQADTLNTSTSLDTSLFTMPYSISQAGEFEYIVAADSISGTQEATIYIEVSTTGGVSDNEWTLYATHTLTGAGHTEYRSTGKLLGRYIRDRIYAPSGTQSTRLVRIFRWRKF